MDPVSLIGLAGSVIGIVDVISKNVSFLRELQSKYHKADLTVSLLCVQLSTLKAALNEISGWIDSQVETEQQGQLVADLAVSLQGCQVLISLLDARLDELQRDGITKKLTSRGKITLLWDESEVKEYRDHLTHQIQALHLLLAAIQCRSMFDQQMLLSSQESRRIIRLTEEDTSSLFVVGGDAESICTVRSDLTRNSKLLDVVFEFDREIFNSKAYSSVFRSTMTQILSRTGPVSKLDEAAVLDWKDERRPSAPVKSARQTVTDSFLFGDIQEEGTSQDNSDTRNIAANSGAHSSEELDWEALQPQTLPRKVAVLGASKSGKSTLVKSLKLWSHGTLSSHEVEEWNSRIRNNSTSTARIVMDIMESMGLWYEIFEEGRSFPSETYFGEDLDRRPEIVLAFESLWKDAAVKGAWDKFSGLSRVISRMGYEIYFFNSLERSAQRDYIPSMFDILFARLRTTLMIERHIAKENKLIRVFDVRAVHPASKKWIYKFDDVDILIFTVDIASFSHSSYEDHNSGRTEESLMLFESIANSQWFMKSHIILLFTKADTLGPHLRVSGYSGGPKIQAAIKYVTEKFVELVPCWHRPLCVSYTSFTRDEELMAQTVSRGIEFLVKGWKDGCLLIGKDVDYFVMGSDGITQQSFLPKVEEQG